MHNKESRKNISRLVRTAINEEIGFVNKKNKINMQSVAYLSDLMYIQNNVDCFEFVLSDDENVHQEALDPLATLEDELEASQKYLDEYRQTQDNDYLRMAKEELTHAKKFLMVVKNSMPNNPRYQTALSHYNELEAEIKKISM